MEHVLSQARVVLHIKSRRSNNLSSYLQTTDFEVEVFEKNISKFGTLILVGEMLRGNKSSIIRLRVETVPIRAVIARERVREREREMDQYWNKTQVQLELSERPEESYTSYDKLKEAVERAIRTAKGLQ